MKQTEIATTCPTNFIYLAFQYVGEDKLIPFKTKHPSHLFTVHLVQDLIMSLTCPILLNLKT
jgi:hypothetical protein